MSNPISFILQAQVPEALTLREVSFNWAFGLTLFVCLVLMALARARQTNVYSAITVGMLKAQSVSTFLRDEMPLRGRASLLLLLNYCISSGLIVYLTASHFGLGSIESLLLGLLVPVLFFLFQFASMYLSGWIIGELRIFRAPLAMKIIGAQTTGLLFFVAATFWILQPDYIEWTLQAVIWIFLIESAFRIVKSVSVVLTLGVSWYYIILYFCTLEILPFLMIYFFGMQDLAA